MAWAGEEPKNKTMSRFKNSATELGNRVTTAEKQSASWGFQREKISLQCETRKRFGGQIQATQHSKERGFRKRKKKRTYKGKTVIEQ